MNIVLRDIKHQMTITQSLPLGGGGKRDVPTMKPTMLSLTKLFAKHTDVP